MRRLIDWFLERPPAGGEADPAALPADPWAPHPHRAGRHHYGALRRDFRWFLEGPSEVRVRTPDEIRAWVAGCTYVPDAKLFQEDDFWQHPHTLEQLRRGDCEDFAVWTWRKLVELGYDAQLVVGRWDPPDAPRCDHAWVLFGEAGARFLFEPLAPPERMIRPLDEVRGEYLPEFGVDRRGERFSFRAGLLRTRSG